MHLENVQKHSHFATHPKHVPEYYFITDNAKTCTQKKFLFSNLFQPAGTIIDKNEMYFNNAMKAPFILVFDGTYQLKQI